MKRFSKQTLLNALREEKVFYEQEIALGHPDSVVLRLVVGDLQSLEMTLASTEGLTKKEALIICGRYMGRATNVVIKIRNMINSGRYPSSCVFPIADLDKHLELVKAVGEGVPKEEVLTVLRTLPYFHLLGLLAKA